MMNPALANTIYSGVSNAFDFLASKVNEKEAKKKNARAKALYDSYNATFNGEGAQGEWGFHLPENDFGQLVLMPLAMDAGKSLLYKEGQLFAKGSEKAYNWIKGLQNNSNDVASAEVPEGLTDVKSGGLSEEPVAAAGAGNPEVQNNMGMTAITNPTNMAFPGYLLRGVDMTPELASNLAYAAMRYAKKGAKLIPRQK